MEKYPEAVVAMAGGRDYYQLPLALIEGDLLCRLVTDFYFPADKAFFSRFIGGMLSRQLISTRFCEGLPSCRVELSRHALLTALLMKFAPRLKLNRVKDRALSVQARRVATKAQAALLCYSYYASEAFKEGEDRPRYRFLFQLHPDPTIVREILREELDRTHCGNNSLIREHELSLPMKQFEALAAEPHLANGIIVASTYTAKTLRDRGIVNCPIHVVPYGVESSLFPCREKKANGHRPFTVLFVGSLVQRKGLSYLLDSIRILKTRQISVILCGRGYVDKQLLANYADIPLDVKVGLSRSEIVGQMHNSDVFVLPSLAEGFGHVILEAMSCGLPAVATPHSCAPDVIKDGATGFIVPIRNAEALAERIDWGLTHPAQLNAMGQNAAVQAQLFTWPRFRTRIREVYKEMIASVE
jgi:glycosyltransferase involved in cell wall biosynthesis